MKEKVRSVMPALAITGHKSDSPANNAVNETYKKSLRVISKTTDTNPYWSAEVDYGPEGHKEVITLTVLSVSKLLENTEKFFSNR